LKNLIVRTIFQKENTGNIYTFGTIYWKKFPAPTRITSFRWQDLRPSYLLLQKTT
jgi:hypothetical protein